MINLSFRNSSHKDTVNTIADEIRSRIGSIPALSIVLGSGFGNVLDDAQVLCEVELQTIPGFPISTVIGHSSTLIKCRLSGVEILVWSGRIHAYEGFSNMLVATPIDVMHALGCKQVCFTNAAGGLNPLLKFGEIVILDDVLDSLFSGMPATLTTGQVFSKTWITRVIDHCAREGRALQHGVYVGVAGPSYETRAEIGMFRKLGADVIGMSTVREAKLASVKGLEVLALSLVTNVLSEVATPVLDHSHVVDVGASSAPAIKSILKSAILTA